MGKARFFPRLALVNLARNGRFYLPYLLSCGGTAAMYYMIRFLCHSEDLNTVRGAVYLQSLMGMGAFIHSVKASLRPVRAGSTCFISVSSSQVCVLEQRSCIISHKNTKCNKNIPVRLGRG